MNENFLKILSENKIEYSFNEPMCCHTTFKIGGDAEVFVSVRNVDELKAVVGAAKDNGVEYFIIGKGSNLLVSDKGIQGAVVSLCGLDSVFVSGNKVECQAGASLMNVCVSAQKAGLSGLEFAYGIPGSIGGALFMNAGAYGGEMCDVVESAQVLTEDGEIITLSNREMEFGYRTSVFKKKPYIVLKVVLKLNAGDEKEIKESMKDFFLRRKEKQPLDFPNAGSTFKRPQGNFAGALIEKNGLKGVSVGGAQVSEKHAGFVINTGNATCDDVLNLIDKIQKTVLQNDGVELETEVIFVGKE